MSKLVYLSGPISYGNHPFHWTSTNNWRFRATNILGEKYVINPALREYDGELSDEEVTELVQKDLEEIIRCDVLLANVWKFTPGTSMEIFFASFVQRKSVITVCPKELRKPWIRHYSDKIFENLDVAMAYIKENYLKD